MLFHAQVHKDAQNTEAVGKVNHEQGPYPKLTLVSWKTFSDFKSDIVNKHPFPVCTATHIGEKIVTEVSEKDLDNQIRIQLEFKYFIFWHIKNCPSNKYLNFIFICTVQVPTYLKLLACACH